MEYVKQQITGFISSNLVQDYPDWSPTTTYTLEVGTPTSTSLALEGTFYYRNILTSNRGFKPSEYLNTKWVKWQVSNAFALLDLSSGSRSVNIGADIDLTFALTYGMDTIGIGYYEAEYITIEIINAADEVVWTYETATLLNIDVEDWWTYMYTDYSYEVDRATMFKIPPVIGTKCRIVFHRAEERASCGFLICGQAMNMGETLNGVKIGFNSFASKTYDDFGSLTIVKRAVQDLIDFETIIPSNELPIMRRRIKDVYNDIVLFILDTREVTTYENLLTLGVIETANEVLSNAKLSTISWSIFEAI